MSIMKLASFVLVLMSSTVLIHAAVPATDPSPSGEEVHIIDELKDVHPRVLFGEAEIEKMRKLWDSSEGAPYKKALNGYLGASNPFKEAKFLKDATDAQRQGYWRMPTLAIHYAITKDKKSLKKLEVFMKKLLELPNWELQEFDSGMGAANIMVGAGLALDVTWNDIDPEFREKFRKKCFYHARAMFHLGHLKKRKGIHYWQNDPGNNHRWHRNAGLSMCLLAAYTGAPEEQWLMQEYKKEMSYIVKWLPHDGSSHEAPSYMEFGISHLVIGVQASDRCLGTNYFDNTFFANVPKFIMASATPNLKHQMPYGDQGGYRMGKVGYNLSLLKCVSVAQDKDLHNGIVELIKRNGLHWGWMAMLWYDQDLAGGDYRNLPVSNFLPDVGVMYSRESWDENGQAVMFKCGPFGGYGLNKYRNENNFAYINVAHDDPDANSFIIYKNGVLVAETDRYSRKKKSANHNTILINGQGQLTKGRKDGGVWSQPGNGQDMSKMGVITMLHNADDVDVVAGEARGSYIATKQRPQLDRFRRALAYVKGDYILVLDDVRAPKDVEISWLMQSNQVHEKGDGKFQLEAKGKEAICDFNVVTNVDTTSEVIDSPADGKKGLVGHKQLRVKANTKHLFAASVYDNHEKGVTVSFDYSDSKKVVATVTGKGIEDVWTWEPTIGNEDTYTLSATRKGQKWLDLGESDRPADPMNSH